MALRQRVLTAVVLIPLVVITIQGLEPLYFALLIAGIVALAAFEWSGLSGFTLWYYRIAYVVSVLAILYLAWLLQAGENADFILYLAMLWWSVGLILVLVYERNVIELKLVQPLRLIIGYLILVPAWWSLIVLRGAGDQGITLVLFLLVLIWVADSAAYFSGKRWGKRRLAQRVSPGKSWVGVIVSLLVVLLLALVSKSWVLGGNENLVMFMLVCVVTVCFSVLGDLVESLVKRIARIKDSGGLLPGHGGVMDRIDSLTAAAPVFLLGLMLMGTIR